VFNQMTGEFMKTNYLQKLAALMAAGLILTGSTVMAQVSTAANAAQPSAVSTSAPWLPPGAAQVLQLAQAKVGDDTIVAYVKNSGTGYYFNADQIIYLRQQGLSDAVLTAMLNQPKPGVAAATAPAATASVTMPTTPAPQPADYSAPATPAPVAPPVTYVQTVPTTVYYSQPYYYPGYAWYPPVSLSFGWGWGGGWHGGGNYGGWHGGGGWHH
jgi:hypothetical protein